MSRVSSFGDCKKDDLCDSTDRGLEDDRGLFHVIEQLAALEGALWSILDGLKSNATHVSYFCREYWGTSASQAQLSLEKLPCNERLKRQVQQACVLESLSLGVASHLCTGIMQSVSVTIRSRLRNLLYYIHENCLVLLDLVCQRWYSENPNRLDQDSMKAGHCPENLNLDILVRVKRYRRLRKGEHIMALRQHNEMIQNVVRQLCRGAASKRPPLSSRSMGSPGDRSPGARGPGSASPQQTNVLSAVNEILSARTPLDRLRASSIRAKMLQYMRFKPLLNVDGSDPECPWPASDPYERYGAASFAQEGPVIWFEPLPPMLPDLEMNPKLPPNNNPDVYTLVLDLDETLVHYFEFDGMGNYDIRPGMHEFVQRMHSLGYELVIFTAATQDYADWVIDQIDPDRLVHHRLYRQHALPWGPIFVKDLSRLGRELDRLLIVDNVQENFMLQPHNGIFICTWYEDPHDTALFGLTPLLEELITTRAKVPEILEKYRDQIPSWAGFDQSQLDGVGYSDFDQGPEEDYAPPPAIASRSPPVSSVPANIPFSTAGSGRQDSYGPYSTQAMHPPAGVESIGARSETSSTMGVVRHEASPPASPPAPAAQVPNASATTSSPHYSQTSPAEYRRAEREVQQPYMAPVEPATKMQHLPSNMIIGSGPAVSSSYPVGYESYQYLPPQRAVPQSGYPQSPQPQQAKAPQPQQATAPQAARPAIRQVVPQAAQPQVAQQAAQVGPQRAQIGATSPAPMQAATQAVAPRLAPSSQPATRPVAPAFSSVSGPYQSGPPKAAQPPSAAMWQRAGLGPHQAPPMPRR